MRLLELTLTEKQDHWHMKEHFFFPVDVRGFFE